MPPPAGAGVATNSNAAVACAASSTNPALRPQTSYFTVVALNICTSYDGLLLQSRLVWRWPPKSETYLNSYGGVPPLPTAVTLKIVPIGAGLGELNVTL